MSKISFHWKFIVMRLASMVFLAGLAYFAYLGFFTRFWQDDWCYDADFQRLGLLGTLKGYRYITTYASNRFSTTLFSGLLHPLGLWAVKLLPLFTILFWLIAIFWLLNNLSKMIPTTPAPAGVTLLVSLALVYFSVYLAPNRFQNIYWRSGILPYTTPTVFGVWLAALLSQQVRRARPSKGMTGAAALLAFFGAGFSEAGGATLTAGLGLLLIWAWMGRRRYPNEARQVYPTLALALGSAILALIVLALSPANALRLRTAVREGFTPPLQTIVLSLRFGFDFIGLSLRGLPLPHAVLVILFTALGFLNTARRPPAAALPTLVLLKRIGLILGAMLILVVAAHAPSAYLEGVPPAERSEIIARFAMLAALAAAAWNAGAWLAGRLPAPGWQRVAVAALLIPILYAGRATLLTHQQLQPRFEKIAAVWDERDLKIKTEKALGEEIIQVRPIDSQYLGGVLEWYPQPNYVNVCAATVYGVKELRATLPW